jgi:hypothetical protein
LAAPVLTSLLTEWLSSSDKEWDSVCSSSSSARSQGRKAGGPAVGRRVARTCEAGGASQRKGNGGPYGEKINVQLIIAIMDYPIY